MHSTERHTNSTREYKRDGKGVASSGMAKYVEQIKQIRANAGQEAEDLDQERDMERLSGNAGLSSRPSVHVYSSSRALFETLPFVHQ
jgi:hypothetical protein